MSMTYQNLPIDSQNPLYKPHNLISMTYQNLLIDSQNPLYKPHNLPYKYDFPKPTY
jgi:hypothetical protein